MATAFILDIVKLYTRGLIPRVFLLRVHQRQEEDAAGADEEDGLLREGQVWIVSRNDVEATRFTLAHKSLTSGIRWISSHLELNSRDLFELCCLVRKSAAFFTSLFLFLLLFFFFILVIDSVFLSLRRCGLLYLVKAKRFGS